MLSGQRILILAPNILPRVTGNAVTVERWRRLLTTRGAVIEVLATEALTPVDLLDAMVKFSPHLVHGHHLTKSGTFFLDPVIADRYADQPFVVSVAGTDINEGKNAQDGAETALKVLRRAQVIISQNNWLSPWLEQNAPELCARLVHVPKAVFPLEEATWDLRMACGWHQHDIIFFLPAGIRPVKGNLECLLALEDIYKARPRLRAAFAGPVLDAAYGEKFRDELARLSFFTHWFPLIPPKAMAVAYASADVVLNTSFSEGMSNAVLEAMAAGRPVLASNIQGNRWPVLGEPGQEPCGILFNPLDPVDFQRQAITLMDNDVLRKTLGKAGRARVRECFRPEAEADGLISAYAMAVRRGRFHRRYP